MSLQDELEAINEGFSKAMAEQDVERVVAYYTDDARLLFPEEPMIRGREAITASFADLLRDAPAIVRFETLDVLEGGDLVVDVGRMIMPQGEGKYVVVYQRQVDGSLKLAVDASSHNAPPTAT